MHDGMQYDPIQDQGHEPFTAGNPAIFKNYLFRYLERLACTRSIDEQEATSCNFTSVIFT